MSADWPRDRSSGTGVLLPQFVQPCNPIGAKLNGKKAHVAKRPKSKQEKKGFADKSI